MTTLNEMIDEVSMNLSGYTLQQDRTTWLTGAVTTTTSPVTSPTILSVYSADNMGRGIIEVDEELMWVNSFDRTTFTATIAPYGRGYQGTTAATHASGAKVTVSPVFPRFSIKRAINDTIRAMGSQLLTIGQTTFTFNPSVTTYEIKDGAGNSINVDTILNLSWQDIGPSQEWIPIRRYTPDYKADTATWGAGACTVTIGDYVTAGRTVKVNYLTQPTPMTNNNDVFTTVTGYPESVRDVVTLGAAYRLITYIDPARLSMVSPQADEIDAKRPFGSGNTTARQMYALYQQRLKEEITAFQGMFPTRVHYSR